MMPVIAVRRAAPALALAAAVLAGCAGPIGVTQPPHFYVLSALPPTAGQAGTPAVKGLIIRVGPVDLPQYLDRPQIVTRSGDNEISLNEFDQWAEPLDRSVSRILAENLSVLLGTDQVTTLSRPGPLRSDYQVAVEMVRFDQNAAGTITLIARWSLYGRDGRDLVAMKKARFSIAAGSTDYTATVAALSRALADLSRDIAAAIRGARATS